MIPPSARRQTGTGPYAWTIGRRFELACQRLGLNASRVKLATDHFQPAAAAGRAVDAALRPRHTGTHVPVRPPFPIRAGRGVAGSGACLRHRRSRPRSLGRPGRRRCRDPRSGTHPRRPRRFQEAHAPRSARRSSIQSWPARRSASASPTSTRIDRDNILQATFWAMAEALRQLATAPALALVDGNRAPQLPCPVQTIIERRCANRSPSPPPRSSPRSRATGMMMELDRDLPALRLRPPQGLWHRAAPGRRSTATAPARSTAGASRRWPHCWRVNHFPGIRFTPTPPGFMMAIQSQLRCVSRVWDGLSDTAGYPAAAQSGFWWATA